MTQLIDEPRTEQGNGNGGALAVQARVKFQPLGGPDGGNGVAEARHARASD